MDETAVSHTEARAAVKIAVKLENVSVDFGQEPASFRALDRISLDVPEGGFTTMIGPSGSGKSTLLRVISDLVSPSEGAVSIFGETAAEARGKRAIGFVFQDATLLPWRTVLANVQLPLEVAGGREGPEALSPRDMLELVGLGGRETALPHELSGGMRQRVAIARALVSRPRLLLMDEPFGALDEFTRDRMNNELLRIWAETKTTIVFVTHSISEAVYLGQEVVVLSSNPGRIRERIVVELPSERRPALRDTGAFTAYTSRLRSLLEI
jgi:NitT/TauT family transport system ATP-binding protein